MSMQFDEVDAEILAERVAERDAQQKPRLGDFVRLKDGTVRRLAVAHKGEMQPTHEKLLDARFYLGAGGYAEFSGSLGYELLSAANLQDSGETKAGRFWFFHHGEVGPHRSVECTAPCRVYVHL